MVYNIVERIKDFVFFLPQTSLVNENLQLFILLQFDVYIDFQTITTTRHLFYADVNDLFCMFVHFNNQEKIGH